MDGLHWNNITSVQFECLWCHSKFEEMSWNLFFASEYSILHVLPFFGNSFFLKIAKSAHFQITFASHFVFIFVSSLSFRSFVFISLKKYHSCCSFDPFSNEFSILFYHLSSFCTFRNEKKIMSRYCQAWWLEDFQL